jgi:hypothetical protein
LANSSRRHEAACPQLRRLPDVRQKAKSSRQPDEANLSNMAIAEVGVNIVGPLPTAPENLRFAAVALEYFTKWIEAKVLVKITSGTLISFMWRRIICCFGVPSYITVDNGKQFNCAKFRNFCNELGIKPTFASVNHPESNGAVKRANGLIFNAVSKALFDQPKGKWAQELISSVWGHNISCTRMTRFTPFCLLYSEETITPENSS